MKQCKKCKKVKSESEFYAAKNSSKDGLRGSCKQCWSDEYRDTYVKKGRKPANPTPWDKRNPEKRATIIKNWNYNHKEQITRASKERNKSNPLKYKARYKVGNAIRDGVLLRKSCEICKEPKTEAHHEDYSKPLDVTWLCRAHHIQADKARVRKELGVTC